MNLWLRRTLYALLLLLWLLVMVFPFLAMTLSSRGELRLGGEERFVRIFLVRGDDNQGIGIATERPLRDQPSCHKASVAYLLWRGQGQNVTYCLCPDSGQIQCPR